MKTWRSDLIIEEESLETGSLTEAKKSGEGAGHPGVLVKEEWKADHAIKVTVVQILDETGVKSMGREEGTYITMELPGLLEEEEKLQRQGEKELEIQLEELLRGKKAEHMLVIGLGNREVTADAIGPLTVDRLLITRQYFQEEESKEAVSKRYRQVSALVPGVMAQTGMETMELVQGIVEKTAPDVVLVVDALAARSPKRLNTTIQLTDTGIRPGAGVGNDRKELSEKTLGCPVIALGVPTVLDAMTIAKEEVAQEVKELFVMPRNIDSAVQYVSELLAGGINRVNEKKGNKN